MLFVAQNTLAILTLYSTPKTVDFQEEFLKKKSIHLGHLDPEINIFSPIKHNKQLKTNSHSIEIKEL
jgi:hypothetical protein